MTTVEHSIRFLFRAALRCRSLVAIMLLAGASTTCGPRQPGSETAAPRAPDRAGVDLFVDSSNGQDAPNRGTSTEPYRTIARALDDVPDVVGKAWTIHLSDGEYPESVALDRFLMPSVASATLVGERPQPPPIFLSLRASSTEMGRVTVRPPPGSPCITASSVVLFVARISCRARGADGLLLAGATAVIDDTHFIAEQGTTSSGIFLQQSAVYLGGSIRFEGPFYAGLSIRTHSIARSGTLEHPRSLDLVFDGTEKGVFLRDHGDLSLFFVTDESVDARLSIRNTETAIYAILGSTAFVSTNIRTEIVGTKYGFNAQHGAGINLSRPQVTRVTETLVVCGKQSYVSLEEGTYKQIRSRQSTDGTCWIRR